MARTTKSPFCNNTCGRCLLLIQVSSNDNGQYTLIDSTSAEGAKVGAVTQFASESGTEGDVLASAEPLPSKSHDDSELEVDVSNHDNVIPLDLTSEPVVHVPNVV